MPGTLVARLAAEVAGVNILRPHHVFQAAVFHKGLLTLIGQRRIVTSADKPNARVTAFDEIVDHLLADLGQIDIDTVELRIVDDTVHEHHRHSLLA
ncbi:hypothetical protein D3C85_1721260 [compost metagenome]